MSPRDDEGQTSSWHKLISNHALVEQRTTWSNWCAYVANWKNSSEDAPPNSLPSTKLQKSPISSHPTPVHPQDPYYPPIRLTNNIKDSLLRSAAHISPNPTWTPSQPSHYEELFASRDHPWSWRVLTQLIVIVAGDNEILWLLLLSQNTATANKRGVWVYVYWKRT